MPGHLALGPQLKAFAMPAGLRILFYFPQYLNSHHHVQRYRSHNSPRKVRLFPADLCFADTVPSGTSGYVVRNLSTLRPHDKNDRASWDAALPKHREPDQTILEHEKKRKVEVKCLELQLELEDKE